MCTPASLRPVGALIVVCVGSSTLAQVAPPPAIPGKEYITAPNTNALGMPVTGQAVGWSGAGPAFDTFVYSTRELDAMAHMGDAHFEGLMSDTAALIVSLSAPTFPGGPTVDPPVGGIPASLFYRNSSPYGSSAGVWATAPMLNPMAPPMQVSGVELWGAVGDTTHWSEVGDPGGVSVFSDPFAPSPYLLTAELEFALGAVEPIDIDAFMLLDHFGGTDLFHVGDFALMSVRANGQFDGGEIWLLERAAGGTLVASFFTHGGVTWDTANDVGALFGVSSLIQEIDALEAVVPAPGSAVLLAGALATLCPMARRRRRASRSAS